MKIKNRTAGNANTTCSISNLKMTICTYSNLSSNARLLTIGRSAQ